MKSFLFVSLWHQREVNKVWYTFICTHKVLSKNLCDSLCTGKAPIIIYRMFCEMKIWTSSIKAHFATWNLLQKTSFRGIVVRSILCEKTPQRKPFSKSKNESHFLPRYSGINNSKRDGMCWNPIFFPVSACAIKNRVYLCPPFEKRKNI